MGNGVEGRRGFFDDRVGSWVRTVCMYVCAAALPIKTVASTVLSYSVIHRILWCSSPLFSFQFLRVGEVRRYVHLVCSSPVRSSIDDLLISQKR